MIDSSCLVFTPKESNEFGMEIIRDGGVVWGLRYEHPLPGFPALTHCGEANFTGGHRINEHRHPSFELAYAVTGEARLHCSGRDYLQTAGSLFIAHPEQSHSWVVPSRKEYTKIWLGIRFGSVSPTGRKLTGLLRRKQCQFFEHAQDLEHLLRAILSQVDHLTPSSTAVVAAYSQCLIALLLQKLTPPQKNIIARNQFYSIEIDRVLRAMNQHNSQRLDLSEMVKLSGHSQSWFCEQFHRYVGSSPQAYHLRLRLERARQVLTQTKATVLEVALAHGFNSSQHFSTCFRKAFKITPRQWRQKTTRRYKQMS